MVFVLYQGVLAGMPPGTLARLSELGDVLLHAGPFDRAAVLALFDPAVRPGVRFELPPELEHAPARRYVETDVMDNYEEG